MKKLISVILVLICLASYSQRKNITTKILFIFDASQSMNAAWETKPKVDVARDYLINVIDSLSKVPNVQMALRIFGHTKIVAPQDCSDTKLEIPFSKNNSEAIIRKLLSIYPKGTTPIAKSLLEAVDDFGIIKSNQRNIVILITDGIEACDGDPCEVSKILQKKKIYLEPFVIGIGIDEGLVKTYNCVGKYFNVKREKKFIQTLDLVISQSLNETITSVNLLDGNGNPTETNVNMSFYDLKTGELKYNYIHTLDYKGKPDNIILDPINKYKLVVHTIPKTQLDSISITLGTKNIIGVDVPQGYLNIESASNLTRDIQYLVRDVKDNKIIDISELNKNNKYIVGKYNVEILTKPIIEINKVEIKHNNVTKITLPRPGLATIISPTTGYGFLYKYNGNEIVLIHRLSTKQNKETLILLPGKYLLVYRGINAKKTLQTTEFPFELKEGMSVPIRI